MVELCLFIGFLFGLVAGVCIGGIIATPWCIPHAPTIKPMTEADYAHAELVGQSMRRGYQPHISGNVIPMPPPRRK